MSRPLTLLVLPLSFVTSFAIAAAVADDTTEAKVTTIEAARGTLTLEVPSGWQRKAAIRIIEHEFSAPPADGDESAGRLTMMSAGGSVKANIDRWRSQFAAPDAQKALVKTKEVRGMKVHLVDLKGTYNDRRGPFAPAVARDNYIRTGSTDNDIRFVRTHARRRNIVAKNTDGRILIGAIDFRSHDLGRRKEKTQNDCC